MAQHHQATVVKRTIARVEEELEGEAWYLQYQLECDVRSDPDEDYEDTLSPDYVVIDWEAFHAERQLKDDAWLRFLDGTGLID